jgi:hypothetical protein
MFSTPIVPLSNTNAVNSATQYFTFQLTNNGKTAINNQQLAIGLSIYNVAGTAPYSLPPDTTANSIMLSSVGLGTTWTNQGYVQPNVIGYENTVTSGVFSVLGQITLVAGQTVTINMSVTATAGGTNTIQPFLMYIQVIPIPSS